MRRVYLIRHGKPDIPEGKRMCLGSTDVPLGTLGRLQSVVLAEYMKDKPVAAVFCGGLSRAKETAAHLCEAPVVINGLREADAGAWDGLSFDEIRRRWPEVYERRGIDPTYPIPGSEEMSAVQRRFRAAVEQALAQSEGDIAVVAHATVNGTLTALAAGEDAAAAGRFRTEYTGVTVLGYEKGGFTVLKPGETPRAALTEELCLRLLDAAGAPKEHCVKVARAAEEIARHLPELDGEKIRFAALLHDIARACPDHPAVGARWLRELGWPEIGEIVACHHDPDSDALDEKAVVYLADKLPVEERFAASRKKCTDPEALAAHDRRLAAARAWQRQINTRCGKEIIP